MPTDTLPAEIRHVFVSESVKVTLDFSVVKANNRYSKLASAHSQVELPLQYCPEQYNGVSPF